MGSASSFCYCGKSNDIPRSDLFVPNFDLDPTSQKEQKRIKCLRAQGNIKKVTTEKFIQKNAYRNENTINSYHSLPKNTTDNLNSKSIILNDYYTEYESSEKEKNKKKYSKYKTFMANKGIMSKEEDENEVKYEVNEHVLSQNEEREINNILLYHYLFHNLDEKQLGSVLKEVKEFQISSTTTIFFEGDPGTCVFLIKKGKVELSSGENQMIIEEGQIFGELAGVMEDVIRTYSAVAKTEVVFYSIERRVLKEVLGERKEEKIKFELFNFLEYEIKRKIQILSTNIEFKKEQVITDLNGLFYIISGSLSLTNSQGNIKDNYFTNEFILCSLFKNGCKLLARENVKCLVVPKFAFVEVLGVDYKYNIFERFFKETICKNAILGTIFGKDNIKEYVKLFKLNEYKMHDMISSEFSNQISNKIMIIVEGYAIIYENGGKNKKIISPCELIGEELFTNEKSKNISVQSNHLITLECEWENFKNHASVMNITLANIITNLSRIYLFQDLPIYKLIDIMKIIETEYYHMGDKIIKSGDKVSYVYFIEKGTVKFIEDGETFKEYHCGSSFGEIFLFNGKEAIGEIIVSSKECTVYKMNKSYFFDLLSDININNKIKEKLCLEDMEIFPSNIYYLTTLHKANNTHIYLVHNKIYLYVIKSIYIQHFYNSSTFEGKFIPNVLNEKIASKRLDNPFIVKYVKTLKNSSWCFFLEEYINGITLEEYLNMCKPFYTTDFCRFLSACFLLMLEFLKEVGIIHRDIKPDNIVIEKNGYPKLIDFSSCKRIKDQKTRTIIGNPFYMAPEVLKGKPYGYSCDYWSTGILIYYMFYGEYPFGKKTDNPDTIYKEILNKKLEFKDCKFDDSEIRMLIISLLNKDENTRYCSLEQLKELRIYKNIDFEELKKKKIVPSFIPEVVKIDYKKELINLAKPFNTFISKEKCEQTILSKNENPYENVDFERRQSVMKWFEKF